MARHESENFARCARFVHQADYIVGLLTGDFDVTDYCNALKTGYDLLRDQWPGWMARLPGVGERLPRVVAAGTPIGKVSAAAATTMTGLPEGLAVVAGATDGVAAAVGAGLRSVGDYNTSLGTTLVFKGIASRIARHPEGLVYSHRLPGDRWLPGAASNVARRGFEPGSRTLHRPSSIVRPRPICRAAWRLTRWSAGESDFPFEMPRPRGLPRPSPPARPRLSRLS